MRVKVPGSLVALLLLGYVATADAQGGLLHEFVPPDPSEDLSLAATTIDGNLPAAIETPSGVATAPDPQRPPDAENLYSGSTTDDTPESTYEPDRDTRQPDIENYDDPFSPSTAPFKRLRAYDAVDPDYTLRVADTKLSLITVGGEAGDADEAFYGDFSVELLPDQPVRIPTVGPGTRVLKMHLSPESQATLLRDGADNWFIRGTERKRVRVVTHMAIPRATFGSEFADASWQSLEPFVPSETRSARHKAQAERVFAAIGISREMAPKQALSKMVEYYRAFGASNDPPRENGDIYLDLALSKKGVCRHRAFAFLVTAINLGLPSRMVVNEAHAWVEVFDGTLWHRIDLGGAALELDQDQDANKPQHVPPPDPFSWPEGSQDNSGTGLADKERSELGEGGGPSTGSSGQDPQADPNGSSAPSPTSSSTAATPPSDQPASRLEVETVDRSVRRGQNLAIRGKVTNASGAACRNVRVDVLMKSSDHKNGITIGSLSTDDQGEYDGRVVVPRDLGAGDYDVFVATKGDARCGPGRSE